MTWKSWSGSLLVGGRAAGAAQVGPVEVGTQILAAHGAPCVALDLGAPFDWNNAMPAGPLAQGAWRNAHKISQRALTAHDFTGFADRVHCANVAELNSQVNSPANPPCTVASAMSIADQLQALIDTRFQGVQAAFARAIDRSPSQVNQWLSGYRKLDGKGARHIEMKLGLSQGYFKTAADNTQEARAPYAVLPRWQDADKMIAEVVDLMSATDAEGRALALGAVRGALANHRPRKQSGVQ